MKAPSPRSTKQNTTQKTYLQLRFKGKHHLNLTKILAVSGHPHVDDAIRRSLVGSTKKLRNIRRDALWKRFCNRKIILNNLYSQIANTIHFDAHINARRMIFHNCLKFRALCCGGYRIQFNKKLPTANCLRWNDGVAQTIAYNIVVSIRINSAHDCELRAN